MRLLPLDLTTAQPLVAPRPPLRPSSLEDEVIALFEQFRGRLLCYINAFSIPEHDGEEIVQEVFLSLFRHLQMGKSRRNLRGWIFRVAHNLALKKRSANQRSRDRTKPDDSPHDEQLDPSLNPEEQVLSKQRRQRLQAAFRVLPEQDRCCLRLRADGLRYREIADVLGMSLGVVSISLARSLSRLARADEA